MGSQTSWFAGCSPFPLRPAFIDLPRHRAHASLAFASVGLVRRFASGRCAFPACALTGFGSSGLGWGRALTSGLSGGKSGFGNLAGSAHAPSCLGFWYFAAQQFIQAEPASPVGLIQALGTGESELGTLLTYLGLAVFVIGAIGTLIAAFKTSILWGLGCLLVAPVSLIFLILHWDVAKNPFFLQLAGVALMFIGGSVA
ncbi:MAG: hypothetical protein QM599_01310 [Pseudoxanthomonas sp.]